MPPKPKSPITSAIAKLIKKNTTSELSRDEEERQLTLAAYQDCTGCDPSTLKKSNARQREELLDDLQKLITDAIKADPEKFAEYTREITKRNGSPKPLA